MSSAETPRTKESQQGVRQILDELDDLMERMMALPVHDVNETSPVAIVEAPPTTQSAHDIEETSAEKPPPPSYSYPIDELPTPESEADEESSIDDDELIFSPDQSRQPQDFVPPPINPNVIAEKAVQLPQATPTKKERHPLLAINRGFDKSTQWMGNFGIWLRGKWGRAFIGLIGITLFALAIFWGVVLWIL